MENLLNLNTYKKYLNLINEGLIVIPDESLLSNLRAIKSAYKAKPYMEDGETHEVVLNAKKIQITSRGSLRRVAIDGIHFDSVEQAACNMYDPYDEYFDISKDIKNNLLDYTLIPIIDTDYDELRYTISKYSKGLSKYFDPHKVVKAVYSVNNIIFYVKDNKDILRKYCFKIASINMDDVIPMVCKKMTEKYGMNETFYLAFFIHEEELPFTIGACQDDFYALKDILNKISFKGTTPLKYMIFRSLSNSPKLRLKEKEEIAYNSALTLTNKTKGDLCLDLDLSLDEYNNMMKQELLEVTSSKGKKVNRGHILKYLHITENVNELNYYELMNLMWKVKYNEIPD